MSGWKRRLSWAGLGIGLIAVGVVLIAADLDRADKIGSVVGALCSVAGLSLSIYGLTRGVTLGRRQLVKDSYIGGHLVRDVKGAAGDQEINRSTIMGSAHDHDGGKSSAP